MDIGRRDEELDVRAIAHRVEIDEALDQLLERIDVERIEVVGREIARERVEPGLDGRAFERQIPDQMKARGMTREQVINEVLLAAQPTKQFVTVDQVAALAVYLCSDAAAQITGANISIDGGWTAQ